MAFNEKLSDRIREALVHLTNVEEKFMFGGVCYMVDGKMCIGVVEDEMMCRINPDKSDEALEKIGCRPMDFTGKPMKGYVFISDEGMKKRKILNTGWTCALSSIRMQKASKKKSKKPKNR